MNGKLDQLNLTSVAIISTHWTVKTIVEVALMCISSIGNHEFVALAKLIALSSHSFTPHYGFISKKVQTPRAERKVTKQSNGGRK